MTEKKVHKPKPAAFAASSLSRGRAGHIIAMNAGPASLRIT
ncbi:hypothetical protein [Megasphaera sp.]